MSRQNQEPDELRARFTVYIKQVIIHAKLDYIRKKNRTSQEISLEDLDFEPAKAVYKIDGIALVNCEIFEKFLESFREF